MRSFNRGRTSQANAAAIAAALRLTTTAAGQQTRSQHHQSSSSTPAEVDVSNSANIGGWVSPNVSSTDATAGGWGASATSGGNGWASSAGGDSSAAGGRWGSSAGAAAGTWGTTASAASSPATGGGGGGWGSYAAETETSSAPTSSSPSPASGAASGGGWGKRSPTAADEDEEGLFAFEEEAMRQAATGGAPRKNGRISAVATEADGGEDAAELNVDDSGDAVDRHGFSSSSYHYTDADLDGDAAEEDEFAGLGGNGSGASSDPFGDRLPDGETTLYGTEKAAEIDANSAALKAARRNNRDARTAFDNEMARERRAGSNTDLSLRRGDDDEFRGGGAARKRNNKKPGSRNGVYPEDEPGTESGIMDFNPKPLKNSNSNHKGSNTESAEAEAEAEGGEESITENAPPVRRSPASLGPVEDAPMGATARVDVAARFEPRLAMLPNASVDAILALQPRDAVEFAANYVSMQHFIRNCRRRRVSFTNAIFLSTLKEQALLSAAISAIEKRQVPIERATRILRAPFLFERMLKYRRYLATLIRSWAVEVILNQTLSPTGARNLLLVANHFGKDARIVGSLAQKAIEDLPSLDNNTIIRIMYAVTATHVRPPSSFWSVLLRQLTRNVHEVPSGSGGTAAGEESSSSAAPATSSSLASDAAASGARVTTAETLGELIEESAAQQSANEMVASPKGAVLTPREVYRVLDCCARVGVFSDINTLTQLSEHAWREIGRRASEANFPDVPVVTARVAVRRLFTVSQLIPHQFFRLIQISSTLGTNFNAGRGEITDKVLLPLSLHLNDHHLSEFIETLALSRVRYAPALQAAIDRVVAKGRRSPAALMHLSRLLRLIAPHNDVCAQLRLAKFFDLLEEVCGQKQTLRTVQMTRIVEDIYLITRRFSRTAPLVVRMQRIVEEFCGSLFIALRRGVVPIDQVNAVLENTVMLGMSKDGEKFPNTKKLRDARRELYAGTKPGAFPAGYKDRVDPSVRFLYAELVFCNQTESLFRQPIERSADAQLQQLIAVAGPLHALQTVLIYNELHGISMPLSNHLQHTLKRHLKHALSDVKTGMTASEIGRRLGYPRGRAFGERDVRLFASVLTRQSLTNLRNEPWMLEFLNAAAMAVGGGDEALLTAINAQQQKSVARRESIKDKAKSIVTGDRGKGGRAGLQKGGGKKPWKMFALDTPVE